MDLAGMGFDVTAIASIIGICLGIKVIAVNINKVNKENKAKENKFTLFLENNILVIVIIVGFIAGIIMSIKNLTGNIANNVYVIARGCIAYTGGSVLFHQLYKKLFDKSEEENVEENKDSTS